MPRPPKAKTAAKDSTANLGFEAKLWLAADKLRNNMDAAEPSGARQPARQGSPKGQRGGAEQYKHVVLGLIFLKYISDSFEEHHAKLVEGKGDYAGANPEDPDEYKAENIFWVPPAARWSYLQNSAKQPTIGKIVDDAMVAIERDNSRLKGVLPKDYARPALDKHRLGELIDLIGTIGLGDKESRSKDILGRVYEPSEARQTARSAARRVSAANQYFLTQFASAEGKNGGQSSGARKTAKGSPKGERGGVHQFYTPSCVVRLLVEMLAPYTALRGSAFLQSEASPQVVSAAKDNGRIYDPACGSGGSLPAFRRLRRVRFAVQDRAIAPGGVQSQGQDSRSVAETDEVKWARRQRPFGLAKRARRVRLRRQQPKQSNATTRRLAIMNLAIRGIEADFGPEHADTFRRDLHPDLRADYVLANPPFNDSDWFRKDDDVRWQPSGARQIAKGNPQGEATRRVNAGAFINSAFRPRATPTSPGCSTSSTTSRRKAWPASSSPMAACPPTSPLTEDKIRKAPLLINSNSANAVHF